MVTLLEELKEKCDILGLTYVDRNKMIAMGFDSPPDLHLLTPFVYGGTTIHWIDTDMVFGDSITQYINSECRHKRFIQQFGAGLCVYWKGFDSAITAGNSVLRTDNFFAIEQSDIRVLSADQINAVDSSDDE